MEKLKHWTAKGTNELVYRISSDFVAQLQNKLEAEGITNSELADRIGVTLGRVSQVLNDPGNLTLKGTVKFARALGMKVAVVAYNDGDISNSKGPINSEIFHACWRRAGAPRDFFELANSGGIIQQVGIASPPIQGDVFFFGATSANHSYSRFDRELIATTNSGVN